MKCTYCNIDVKLVTGKTIYPHLRFLRSRKFYQCPKCKAYVGTHSNSNKPLGTVANASLRKNRSKVHKLFDPIWKSRKMTRSDAYKWFARELRINKHKCHIALFDIKTCLKAINLLEK